MTARRKTYSEDLGELPVLEWIELERLTIDKRYQRQLGEKNAKHIRRICANFRWDHYQPIIVTETAGDKFAVIDGQHRYESAKLHPKIDSLPCYVVDAPNVEQQAGVFIAANSQRIGLNRLHTFWAAHAAGDATALRIFKLCEAAGVTIRRTPTAFLPPLETIATFTIEKLLRDGGLGIASALSVLAKSQPKVPNVFRSCHIAALARLAGTIGPTFDEPRMVRLLEAVDLDDELAKAKADRARQGGRLEQALEKRFRARYERRNANGVR